MNKNNLKIAIVFGSFAIGIGSILAYLISNNHTLTKEMGVIPYWDLILKRMTIITPDFYNQGSYIVLGIIYFALILLIGFIIIKKIVEQTRPKETSMTVSTGKKTLFHNTLTFISVKHPMRFYGIPGIIMLFSGIVVGYNFLDAYLVQKSLFLGSLFGSLVLILIGIILIATSIILFSMTTLWKQQK